VKIEFGAVYRDTETGIIGKVQAVQQTEEGNVRYCLTVQNKRDKNRDEWKDIWLGVDRLERLSKPKATLFQKAANKITDCLDKWG